MRNKIIILISLLIIPTISYAQRNRVAEVHEYNRSSLYTFTILHQNDKMYNEMFKTMSNLPSPEKYNNHNLNLRILVSDEESRALTSTESITHFLKKNQVAKRLVSKWFNRDKATGSFDVELVSERGNYNATIDDLKAVMMNARGLAMLADAGEQLIPNTFVLVNEITYVDKEEQADMVGAGFALLAALGEALGGTAGDITKSVGAVGAGISQLISGFRVDIKTNLYKLKWNEEIAQNFYANYYYDSSNIDLKKKEAFENDSTLFELEYVGDYSARSSKIVTRGLYNEEDVFNKVLSRATDENIVQLQRKYEDFKVVSTIAEVKDHHHVLVHIGMKEGVTEGSQYEVLERTIDKDGTIFYKRKGVIKPENSLIWDNRCMAVEEYAKGSGLKATTFEVVQGTGELYPGLIVREIRN